MQKKIPQLLGQSENLAQLVLAAMRTYEDGFDHAAANAAKAKAEEDRKADPDNPYAGLVDFRQFYRLTMRDACALVCPDASMIEPVYFLIDGYWNDIQIWACEILGLPYPGKDEEGECEDE
jgi:hypothetical protein